MRFTIYLNPVSKKNSQQVLMNRSTGRPFIAPSKVFKAYEKECARFLPLFDKPITGPVNIKALFYRGDRRKCDLVNLEEALLDVLVKYKVIEDDNFSVVQSMDGSGVLYDKENPRTEVTIEAVEEVWNG